MAYYLIENEGLFVGGSSAVNLCGVVKYGRKNKKQKIVTVLHDSGNRYLKKIYSSNYRMDKGVDFVRREEYKSEDLDFI